MVALTIFHKILHAEFFREIVEAIGAGNYTQETVGEIYTTLQNNNNYVLYNHIRVYRDWSHNFMANYFVDTLAEAIQEFDTGVAIVDGEAPMELYLQV